MKKKPFLLTLIFIFLGMILSACSGAAFAATSWPGVLVTEDTAFVAYNTAVYALNLDNGSLKWTFPPEPNNDITFYSDPVLTPQGELLVGGYNNVLYSLDPQNGNQIWTFEDADDRFIGSPLVTDGAIFAPSADRTVYALDLNGNLMWSFEAEEPLWARPTIDGEMIFFTSMDHNLYALAAENGDLVWSQDLGGASVSTPALSEDDRLYVGTFAKEVLALDTNRGEILWKSPIQGWIWASPVLDGDQLYIGDLDGFFYALDATTGDENWQLQPDGKIAAKPLVMDERVYFTTENGSLVAINRDGSPVFTQNLGGRIFSRPVLAGDLILVTPIEADELVIALDSEGGRRWSFTPEQ
jgi:outer membrane protein assembly factor BamB